MNFNTSSTNFAEMTFSPVDLILNLNFPMGRTSFLASILVGLVVMGIWFDSLRHSPRKNIPPGPRNLLELIRKLGGALFDLDRSSKILEAEYGKIVGIFSYFLKTVVISDFKTLQTAFKNPAIIERAPSQCFHLLDDGILRGITFNSGESWKELRRFTMNQLKTLGLRDKSRLNSTISEQVEECISLMREKIGQHFSSKQFFDIAAVNTLWRIMTDQKFSLNDPKVQNLTYWLEKMTSSSVQASLLCEYPKLGAWLLFFLGVENPFPEARKHLQSFTSNLLETRLQPPSLVQETNEDFTKAFLSKVQFTKDVNSSFYGQLGYENFKEVIRDLFFAGSGTTGTTLSWALLYLALHPEKQKKLQNEIQLVLGTQTPTLDDKPKMKYTEAVINETLRKSSHFAFGLPHAATEDTSIGEFHIPKGTTVSGNVYAILHCAKTWGDPYTWRPERFLNEDETTLIKYDELIPFGVGRRTCPAMALAYDELFMFITRIFQEFTITWNPEEAKPDMRPDPRSGFGLKPIPQALIITERKHEILE